MVASRNSSLATSARRKPAFVVRPRMAVASSARTSAWRAVSRSGPCAMTLPSIGSYDVLTTWPALERVVDPDALAGPSHQAGRAGLGQEAAEGVLGVDPGLDGMPVDREVLLRQREGCARRDPELLLDQVERPAGRARRDHGLGDGVLDLEPGVHLQEVEVAGGVVEQELHGAGVGVADLARERHGRLGEASRRSASTVGPGASSSTFWWRRCVEQSRSNRWRTCAVAVGRAPAPRRDARTRRTSPRAGCRRRRRCRASRAAAAVAAAYSSAERTTRIPLPPPPAAALTSTGKAKVAGSASTAYDGMTGTPAATAISRAWSLRPIRSITSALGPTSTTRAGRLDRTGERRALGEEAVARVDRVGAARHRRGDHLRRCRGSCRPGGPRRPRARGARRGRRR